MVSIILIVSGVLALFFSFHIYSRSISPEKKEKIGTNASLIIAVCAILAIIIGIFLLTSDKHGGIAPYYDPSAGSVSDSEWDRLSEDGKYISESGKEYIYYIVIRGSEYEFNGVICESIDDIKTRLSRIKQENTVMLVDSYAAASAFHNVESVLRELGINYEIEEV